MSSRFALTIALVAALCAAGCGPPKQRGHYVVVDPGGMSMRMATLCYWGLYDCGGDVSPPAWAAVRRVAPRRQAPPSGRVGDETPTVTSGPAPR
ncbi:MAG: hypothetical protein AAF928_07560 [Myxococcota bacterium]